MMPWHTHVDLTPLVQGGPTTITADQGNILVALRDTAHALDPAWAHAALDALVSRAWMCFDIARSAPIGPMIDGPVRVHAYPWEYVNAVDALMIVRRQVQIQNLRDLRVRNGETGDVVYHVPIIQVLDQMAQLLPDMCRAVGRDATKEWPTPGDGPAT